MNNNDYENQLRPESGSPRHRKNYGRSMLPPPPDDDFPISLLPPPPEDDSPMSLLPPPPEDDSPMTMSEEPSHLAEKQAAKTQPKTPKSSAKRQLQAQNESKPGLIWYILYYAYILIGFPIFLLTFLFCGLIDEVLDIGFEGNNPLGKAARWSWENLKISFYYWRKIGIIVAAIIIIIVIIEALF